ncbi:MAG: DUF1080 domain-containing protein [Planctomycetes bacterium]|nr:DUF1080 domain-containing protein [Planctomycetota bacterium]MCB9869265.1 DUF1080 domain-containing protein [Planctomycetota bacterium]MCB9889336.1 DUF1080 domain-containing protein [Planctomycetota bacterium]
MSQVPQAVLPARSRNIPSPAARRSLAALSLAALSIAGLLPRATPAQAARPEAPAAPDSRIPVLLVSGANNHDWQWTHRSLQRMLEESGRFAVTVTTKPGEFLADAKAIAKFKAFVLDYNGPRWGDAAENNFLAAVRHGTGVTVVHAANNAFPGWDEYEKLVALCWRQGTGHGRFHPFDVKITDREHPLTRGMPDLRRHPDELYHKLVPMHGTEYRVLATAFSSPKSGGSGRDEPMIVVKNYGEGRVFHTPLGHVWTKVPQSRASHADPQLRWLIARGTEWAATGEVTLAPEPPNVLTEEERRLGFRTLFNGRDLTGWRGYRQKTAPAKGWEVQNGAIHHRRRGGGGDLITEEKYACFELRFEWKVAPKANSGVIYLVAETRPQTYETGPEYQVLDNVRAGAKHSAAALYDLVGASGAKARPTGTFNTGRIVLSKGRVQHWLNGVKVVDAPIRGAGWKELVQNSKFKDWPEFGTHDSGHIALQDHGDEVWYRSVRIRVLPE